MALIISWQFIGWPVSLRICAAASRALRFLSKDGISRKLAAFFEKHGRTDCYELEAVARPSVTVHLSRFAYSQV